MTGGALHLLYAQLVASGLPPVGAYSAAEIPGLGGHMAALSSEGRPCLLVRTGGGARPQPMVLSGLSAKFATPCTVTMGGKSAEPLRVTVLECTAPEEARPHFAEFGGTILRLLGPSPTPQAAADAVARFAAIFAALARPSRQSVTGLIGELMVLLLSRDPAGAVACWRTASGDRFDFASPDAVAECKATSARLRLHSFSWEQCNPPLGVPALMVSMFVEVSGGGTSVRELLDRIETRLAGSPDSAVRLRETVASTMGAALPSAMAARFDEEVCRQSVLWFDLQAIPAIRGDLPVGVGGVRFTSDLALVPPVRPSVLLPPTSRLSAILPEAIEGGSRKHPG